MVFYVYGMACCLFELCPIPQLAVWLTLHWLIFIPQISSAPAIPCFILWLLWSPSIVRLFVVCNCQAEPGADLSYGDVGYHAYGNFGRVLVEWAIILSQTGNYLYSQYRICIDRKSTRLNSSHLVISYAVFCLKKKKKKKKEHQKQIGRANVDQID